MRNVGQGKAMKENIAFIGMGVIGVPMTANLLKAGYPLTVHTRTKSKAQSVLGGGDLWADTPAQAAKKADVVITCLPDTPDVQKVLLGPDGVIETARRAQSALICLRSALRRPWK